MHLITLLLKLLFFQLCQNKNCFNDFLCLFTSYSTFKPIMLYLHWILFCFSDLNNHQSILNFSLCVRESENTLQCRNNTETAPTGLGQICTCFPCCQQTQLFVICGDLANGKLQQDITIIFGQKVPPTSLKSRFWPLCYENKMKCTCYKKVNFYIQIRCRHLYLLNCSKKNS